MADVIVVGGGVIGLTTAVTLAERGLRVRVWSRDPAGATTSAVAGALWWPYRIEPAERVGDWSLATLAVYEELSAAPEETGVRRVAGLHHGERLAALGDWSAGLKDAAEVPEGLRVTLPLLDMPVHLAWLERRLAAAGGAVERRAVTGFGEAAERSRVVVNCTGLGARELVPDAGVRPVRGQLVAVENPGIEEWYTAADPASAATTYFFPQPGQAGAGRYSHDGRSAHGARPGDGAGDRGAVCAGPAGEIAGARVLGHRVGLRARRGRPGCGSRRRRLRAAVCWCTTTGTAARA